MSMKHGTIKWLDDATQTGVIAGQKETVVIFDANDLRGVQFCDLKKKMSVLYRDLKVANETFREALRVVVDSYAADSYETRKCGVIRLWNSNAGLGVLHSESGDSVFFSLVALDESFGRHGPQTGTTVEYEDQCLHGRRIATLVSKLAATCRDVPSSLPRSVVNQILQYPFWLGKLEALSSDGTTPIFFRPQAVEPPLHDVECEFPKLEGREVEYELSSSGQQATRVQCID